MSDQKDNDQAQANKSWHPTLWACSVGLAFCQPQPLILVRRAVPPRGWVRLNVHPTDMPLAVAIKTEDSKHIGFLLLAPNAADTMTGIEMGDCIFRSLPMEVDDIAHELAERLYDYQQRGEFEYRCQSTSIDVAIDADLHIRIDLDGNGQGSISEIRQDGPPSRIGLAEAPQLK